MISRLKQLENYPIGDCMRTVFACLLNKENPKDVPNFMEKGEKLFNQNIKNWLAQNDFAWVEVSMKDWHNHPFLPVGYCGISGKSPRGDFNHIVIGEIREIIRNGEMCRVIHYIHDTSPYHDGIFIDGEPLWIGFLLKKLGC